jgi:GNAT superfamily N-acetyltransferase
MSSDQVSTISGQWGKPSEVLLDIVQEDGRVHGIVNPGRQNAAIRTGTFDERTGAVLLEGEHVTTHGEKLPFRIAGRLDGRTLRLEYSFGYLDGAVDIVRVEEYIPPRLTVAARVAAMMQDLRRHFHALGRPSRWSNEKRLRRRGESLDSIVCRHAVPDDVSVLAELHVTTWNATYRTSRGPSIETRRGQWQRVFDRSDPREFTIVLEDRQKRLIGFAFGAPSFGEFDGVLGKIYLRWEYHGLGLGRRLLAEAGRAFLERGMESFVLFAERSNPSIGFYDRMGGERLLDERGLFTGAYGWRDVRALVDRLDSIVCT